MKEVKQYRFYKTKYGNELLVDVVFLKDIRKYVDEYPVHRLTYYDITLITEGEGSFIIDDYEYSVRPGNVIFSLPGQVRRWDKDHIINGLALIFEEEFLLSFFNDVSFIHNLAYFKLSQSARLLSLNENEFIRIDDLIKNIKQEIDSSDWEKDEHVLRALLYQTLTLLNRYFIFQHQLASSPLSVGKYHMDKFTTLVETEFSNHHSIPFYADKLCITPNYLNEIVKSITGNTAKQIIQSRILLEAKKLLLYSSLSVSEIAIRLNYETTSYFIRFFRNQTGRTPLSYRNCLKP